MKNIEEIVDEYEAYQRDHADETKEDIVNYLISEIDRNYEKLFLYTDMHPGEEGFIAIVKRLLCKPEKYEKISKIMGECQLLTLMHNTYLESLLEIIDDNNLNEVAKLIDFLAFYYQQELVHLEGDLYSLDDGYADNYYGEEHFDKKQSDFNKFIEDKINRLRSVKAVEKKLKI